jgi:hypothetical protein
MTAAERVDPMPAQDIAHEISYAQIASTTARQIGPRFQWASAGSLITRLIDALVAAKVTGEVTLTVQESDTLGQQVGQELQAWDIRLGWDDPTMSQANEQYFFRQVAILRIRELSAGKKGLFR